LVGKIISFIFIKILYRRIIKNIIPKRYLGGCVFKPSCSLYAELALEKHNVFKAIKLIIHRYVRCDGKKVNFGTIDVP